MAPNSGTARRQTATTPQRRKRCVMRRRPLRRPRPAAQIGVTAKGTDQTVRISTVPTTNSVGA